MSFFLSKLIGNTATASSPSNASSSSAAPARTPILSPTSAVPRSKYHMRVLLRGDKECGKSALLKRLQGGGFIEQHVVTQQTAASHIQWSYKTSEESVSVEVWDVVDTAPPRSSKASTAATPASSPAITPIATTTSNSATAKQNSLAQSTSSTAASSTTVPSSSSSSAVPLDASSAADLYHNVHAVLFLIDPSREWTFSYVKSQLPSVPSHIDVLLLLNFRDLPDSERGAVTCTTVEQYMRGVGDRVRYVECSMRNGYGLKHIHAFLNIPFLHLKRDKLRQEIKELERETDGAAAELELMSEMDYASYNKWLGTQVAEREKDMTEEERKIELEKRIQQERLMLLLADERKKDEDKKATLIKQEKEKQQKEQERLQAEERKRLEKEAKKKKASGPSSAFTPTAATLAAAVQPSLVIDKARERLELDKDSLDDFAVDDNNDDFFGESTTNLAVHNELQARQDRTRPAERGEEDMEDGLADEDELDVQGGRAANGLSEQKERDDEDGVEDDDVLEEPAWELDEPVATYASPFGIGGYGGSAATKAAEEREREKREAREKEKETERERDREKERERERRAAEKRHKEAQRERELEERITKEKEEDAQRSAQALPSDAPRNDVQDAFADEEELNDDANTFRRPTKQYSFDDEDNAAAGPVFDDEEDGTSVAVDGKREQSSEASKQTFVLEEAEELDMDFSSLHRREEDSRREAEAVERRKRDERRQAQTSVLINPDAAHIELPRLDLTDEEEARSKAEKEDRQKRAEEKNSLIFVPTATAPAVPDADLDIFGAAGREDTPRKEKQRVQEKGKERERGRDKAEKRSGANDESANEQVALTSFYGGLVPSAASTNASSAASSTASSPRTKDSGKNSKHNRVKVSDSDRSNDDSDTLDQHDAPALPHSRHTGAKKDDRSRGKDKEQEKGSKRRTVVKKDQGLEADLELDQPLDIAAEIESAKKERDRKEKEAREQQRRRKKDSRAKDKDRDKDRDGKSRRAADSEEVSDDDEEERRKRKKDKRDRMDKEKGRGKRSEESDRRKKRDDDSEEQRSDDEDSRKQKAKKEKERLREKDRERDREDERRKKKKKDKHSKQSDSDELDSSAAEEDRSSKPRKGKKKNAVDAFYDDDEAYAGKRVAASSPPPVVVSGMGSQPAAGQGKSSGFFSNLLRSNK